MVDTNPAVKSAWDKTTKIIDAKLSKKHELEIWGDGQQTRSFMYITDCVKGILDITASDTSSAAIAYPDSATCTGSSRTGCQLRVTLTYRQPLLVPLVGAEGYKALRDEA